MRGVTVELPAAAAARLSELQLQRDAALDSMRGAQGRANSLPADAAHQMRERLAAERDRHAERHRQLAMLVSRVNQWCVELRLPFGSELAPAPMLDIKLAPGETVAQAIGSVRAEIAALKQQMVAVRSAPLKRSSQQEAINAYLARLSQQARPKIGFDVRGNARVSWTEDLVTSKDDLLGLLAFMFGPEQLAAAFARELEQEPERADAVTPIERDKRIAELSASLLSLERREEALLDRAANDGLDVLRRPDADPRAVLNVAVVAKEVQPSSAA
jgi:hypothetical protein